MLLPPFVYKESPLKEGFSLIVRDMTGIVEQKWSCMRVYSGEMRLLFVEDDQRLAQTLSHQLKKQYVIDVCGSVAEAELAAEANTYDVLILDISLPDGDGISFAKELRLRAIKTPILMLTANGEVLQKISALDGGADDYMTKPFSVDELRARLRALLRRKEHRQSETPQAFADLTIHPTQMNILCNNSPLPLQKKDYMLLECLIDHAERLISKTQLIECAWDMNAEVSDNAIDTHIKTIRKILVRAKSCAIIKTKKGIGFTLKKSG